MAVGRRDFLKLSAAGAFLSPFGFDLTPAIAQAKKFKIARLIKKTRDAGFIAKDGEGRVVNRLDNIAAIGGCTDTNEFNWLFQKVARAWSIAHLEQQSRI